MIKNTIIFGVIGSILTSFSLAQSHSGVGMVRPDADRAALRQQAKELHEKHRDERHALMEKQCSERNELKAQAGKEIHKSCEISPNGMRDKPKHGGMNPPRSLPDKH